MMYLEEEMLRRLDLCEGTGEQAPRPVRVAIYSHDAEGLGHLRRNLLISRSLYSDDLRPSILLISGLRESAMYDLPEGVDSVTLPALGKSSDGTYSPRSLRVETEQLVKLRTSMIHAAIESYRPDVLIVDKLPLGIFGELRQSLAWLRKQTGARVILGLRDILDQPETVRREWARDNCVDAIRSFYDRIWVYGDRRVYDTASEYALPADVASMVRYAGYLNPREVPAGQRTAGSGVMALAESMDLPTGDLTLCVIGGGRDGVPLASSFLRARLPEGSGGVLVTGPLMNGEDRALLHTLATGRDNVRLIEFVSDPLPLMCCADRVISMGGYNTVCEVLAFNKRSLVVPRVVPRREQIIRAERFASLGLLDMLHPDGLSADALSTWISKDAGSVRAAETVLDFRGTSRLSAMLLEELATSNPAAPMPEIRVSTRKAAEHA